MIDGIASNPFSATTLPPLSKAEDNEDKIIRVSRERYAKSREVVEDKIMRWSGLVDGEVPDEPEKKPKFDKQKRHFVIFNWWWEENVEATTDVINALVECFTDFCNYLRAEKISLGTNCRSTDSMQWVQDLDLSDIGDTMKASQLQC